MRVVWIFFSIVYTFFFLSLSVWEKTRCRFVIVVVALLFYVHGKHLRSCRDDQLT